eukprot:CAMPEP_0119322128 /NCGR_PEP_ID=MMETSP1333-20130426/57353_1 /TAXON_ID=418940 /ORGANISM="Scyphosphaera apsteinii, Strain RCC1455" /LENGTH=296 /DNA_ID=CAMNT_0007329275 /DNA_START=263 /DNA_END=1154 /DNA_ORIENTATION=-
MARQEFFPSRANQSSAHSPYVAVIAWTHENRAVCETFARRTQNRMMLDSLLSLNLRLSAVAGVHVRGSSWLGALEQKMQAHTAVLQLLANASRSVALIDCDVAFFHQTALALLFQLCHYEMCFLREEAHPGNVWQREVNSGFVLVTNTSKSASRDLLSTVSARLSYTLRRRQAPGRVGLNTELPFGDQTVYNLVLRNLTRTNLDWGVFDKKHVHFGCSSLPNMEDTVLASHAVQTATNSQKLWCLDNMYAWVENRTLLAAGSAGMQKPVGGAHQSAELHAPPTRWQRIAHVSRVSV